MGEITGFRKARKAAYFELRDAEGAMPCSMWLSDLDGLGIDDSLLVDGAGVVIGGGLDYYPGSATSSPSFCSASPTCAWPARATCSPGSPRCASSSRPTVCSARRRS